ncbi:MAG TPA: peptide MFS transporter [Blastocatellia bacterium]|nr:peptide MFS transporter [Blastocatellia bacterium]
MATNTAAADVVVDSEQDRSGIGGHPRGLTTLFFTEMWERFSYYGMRALLMLFMTKGPEEGGLGFAIPKAAAIYGAYTASVYLMSLPGGWVADNLLGARLSVLFGGILIACGHFSMVFASLPTFYAGLILIVFGTGLLKPNISTMVGSLYSRDDPRRDAGFSIFYMGINLGAFLAPIVCGFLAQNEWFKAQLGRMGFHPEGSWHWGFAMAGIGMTFGLIQYLVARRRLAHVGNRPRKKQGASVAEVSPDDETQRLAATSGATSTAAAVLKGLTWLLWAAALVLLVFAIISLSRFLSSDSDDITGVYVQFVIPAVLLLVSIETRYLHGVMAAGEKARAWDEAKRLIVIWVLFIFSTIFWMAFEQAGSSLNLFADKLTQKTIFGFEYPSSWMQSVNSIFLILLAPVFSWIWLRLKDRDPSSPAKFANGLLFVGLGFLVLAYASSLTGGGPVSPLWLIFVYLLHTVGELSLSPVGMSTVTKIAPPRLVGLMMGLWFLSISIGNLVGGWVAGHFETRADTLVRLFGIVALTTIGAAAVLAALTPYVKKLMGRVR